MADDIVDNEHLSFVIIADDTVNNEHPRVNTGILGDEAEGQQTNGSTVGSKKDVDSKDDIGETDAHGHNKTDETDDGANIEDKNREIDIKGEDNRETAEPGQTVETDDGTNTEDKNSAIDIKKEGNRSANESVSLEQGNVHLLDNNSVKTEEKKDANTELREDDNIGMNAGTLGDEAEVQPTNGSNVGSKNDVDNKDVIGETDTHGHQQTDDTDDGTKIKDKHSEIDIKVEDNRENDSIRRDQAQVQLSDDKNDDESKGETSVNTKACNNDNIDSNDIPEATGSDEQIIDYTKGKQSHGIQDPKDRLLHSEKGLEELQNDVEYLRKEIANYKSAGEDYVKKDISNQIEINRLKELNSDLQTRRENELEQIHRKLANEIETQNKKHKQDLDEMRKRLESEQQTHKKLAEEKETQNKKLKKDLDEMRKKMESKIAKKDEEIKEAKTKIQKHEDEISKLKRESVRQNTVAKEKEQQLHATGKRLDEAYQCQEKMQSEINEKENQLQLLSYKFDQSLQDKESFRQQVQVLTAEKKDLLLRLSKVASANMTYNNPNIADLSDEKRPTKLAEEFSELYDNEWTDAFEVIEEKNEKEKIRFMYELLMRANQLCMDLSNRHTRKVKQSIATLTLLMPNRQEQHRTGECLDKEKLRQGEQGQNLQENGDEGREKGREEDQDSLTEKAQSSGKSQNGSESDDADENNPCTTHTEKAEVTSSSEKPNRPRMENENAKKHENNLDEDDTEEKNLDTTQTAGAEDTLRTEGDPHIDDMQDEKSPDQTPLQGSELIDTQTAEEKQQAKKEKQPKPSGTCEAESSTNTEGDPHINDMQDEKSADQISLQGSELIEAQGDPHINDMQDEKSADQTSLQGSELIEAQTAEEKQQAKKEKQPKPSETCEAESSTNTEGDPHIDDMQDEKPADQTASQESELIDTQISPEGDDVQQQLSKDRDSMESKEHTKDDDTSDIFTPKNEGNLPADRNDDLKRKKIQATEGSQSQTEGEFLAEQKVDMSSESQKIQATEGSQSQTEGEFLAEQKGDMSSESQVADRNDIILQPKPKKKRLESDFEKLQTEQKKTILEATKFFETLLSENVKNAVKEIIVNEKGIDDEKQKCVVVYIEKCIDLCWSMLRHKPPVHVDLPDIISDTPFDTNKYKPYTKTGKHLAYLVWPALYLHEGGPLLSKGVAQGK